MVVPVRLPVIRAELPSGVVLTTYPSGWHYSAAKRKFKPPQAHHPPRVHLMKSKSRWGWESRNFSHVTVALCGNGMWNEGSPKASTNVEEVTCKSCLNLHAKEGTWR